MEIYIKFTKKTQLSLRPPNPPGGGLIQNFDQESSQIHDFNPPWGGRGVFSPGGNGGFLLRGRGVLWERVITFC